MKSSACSSNASIFSTSCRSSRSLAHASSRNAARSRGARSSAAAKSSSTSRQRSGFIGCAFSDHAIEPRLRTLPFAAHGAWRNVQHLCCLVDVQAAEVTQLDDSSFLRIDLFERTKRFIEREEVFGRLTGD